MRRAELATDLQGESCVSLGRGWSWGLPLSKWGIEGCVPLRLLAAAAMQKLEEAKAGGGENEKHYLAAQLPLFPSSQQTFGITAFPFYDGLQLEFVKHEWRLTLPILLLHP